MWKVFGFNHGHMVQTKSTRVTTGGGRRSGFACVVIVGMLVLAACGSASSTSASTTTASSVGKQGQTATQAVPGYTKGMSATVSSLYTGGGDIVGPSAYRNWKAEKTPWTICFNNSYIGNTWRAAALAGFNKAVGRLKAAGLVNKVYVTDSNLSAPTQITQMTDMVKVDHCSGIVTIPTGSSSMAGVIQKTYNAGVPVVGDLGPTTSPYEENVDANFYSGALAGAEWLAKQIHGHGNIVDVQGIPGETLTNYYEKALKKVLAQYPNIHLLGTVSGKYTDTLAKTGMLQFLGTHPQSIAGIYEEGGMGQGVVSALQQEGRPIVPMSAVIGSGNMIGIWHQLLSQGKPAPFFAPFTDPPGFVTQLAVRTLVRILEGQHPLNMTVYYPLSSTAINSSNLSKWWNPQLTPSTTLWPEPPGTVMSASALNAYFSNGHKELPYAGKG